jgi:HAD superfamily hydrolase (TIGR01509 family)
VVVVFDVGNVLLRWDPRNLYRKIFPERHRMEWFLDNVCDPAWNLEQDRGRSFADGVALLLPRFPALAAEIRAYDTRWAEMLDGAIAENVAILEALRGAGEKSYAITNFSNEKWLVAQELHPFLRGFDTVIVSGDEKLVKPDPAIYRLLLERAGLAAADCIFVDDSERNVIGARHVGMQAIHYTPDVDLAAELTRLGCDPFAALAAG